MHSRTGRARRGLAADDEQGNRATGDRTPAGTPDYRHLLRRDDSNLMRHVAFDADLKRPHQLYKKTGHPRASWVDDNLERVYGEFFNDNWDQTDPNKRQDLVNAAMENRF